MPARTLLTCLFLAACSGSDDPPTDGGAPSARTWYADAKPVLDQHCVRCHNGSGLGPGDFSDPVFAQAYATAMIARIDAGEMPPPAADPSCHDYEDSDRFFMDPAARDVLQGWIDNDFALGDPATEPEGPPAIRTLANRDLELRVAAPYQPDFVDRNEYRCFILDLDTTSDVWITGFEPIIDQTAISHHTVFFVDPYGDADKYVTDEATRSWKCPDVQPDDSWSMLHAWAPGNNPVEFPPDHSMGVNAGAQVILQMHYFDVGTPVADNPGYYFSTTDTAPSFENTMFFIGLGPQDYTVPAGESAFTVDEDIGLNQLVGGPVTTTVYGVFPHMHVLGKSYAFSATDSDDNESCISEADGYDFANQPTYWFEEPIVLPPGSTVHVECTYDNSAGNPDQLNDPPVDVSYGENTDQEMCFALLYASLSF